MKILLTGSSGFIGKQFLLQNEYNHNVIPADNLKDIKVKNLKGIATVVHLAGLTNINKNTPKSSFLEINLDITRNLALKCKEAGVKQFIFLSTIKVHDTNLTNKINEKTKCNPSDYYGLSKHLAEAALSEIETSQFKVAIIRSPIVYGPGVKGRFFNLIKYSDTSFPLPFKNFNSSFSAVFVGNLVQLINRIVAKNAKGIFLARDPKLNTFKDFFYLIRYFLRRKIRFFKMPSFLLPFLSKFNKKAFQGLFSPPVIDNSMTNNLLDFQPPYSMTYGLNQTINWYKTTV
ncbi:NAD-dependent epimerase/dehydratase family protein [Marine Group III euryarchaeote]|nr:NAD-dependent epimerase/dehydratase family protein [Marine Group III euryarchaeote]